MPLLEESGIIAAEATEASTSVERRGNMLVAEVPDHREGPSLYTQANARESKQYFSHHDDRRAVMLNLLTFPYKQRIVKETWRERKV